LSAPAASIVVCTRHRAESLARCLESLRALDHPSYEIVVVDNSPGDPNTKNVAEAAAARYVDEPRGGLSVARNTGALAAQGSIVAYVDDDCVADPAWLNVHAETLSDPAVGASTGRILPVPLADATRQAYHDVMTEDLGGAPRRIGRDDPWWFEIANFAALGLGGNMAFRRTLFERGLRFRPSLGLGAPIPGAEENNAFFMVIRDGYEVAYLPEAVVRHYGPNDLGDLRRRRVRMMRGGIAYMLMLLVEEPEYRPRTLRYMAEGLRGKERSWRPGRGGPTGPPRSELAAAAVRAPLDYLKARRVDRRARAGAA